MPHANLTYLPEMLAVEWQAMDDDHERLFAQLETVKRLCMDTDELPLHEAEILYTVLVEHCALEEGLAQVAGLEFGRHGIKHRNMLHTIRKMLDEVIAGHVDVFSLLRYVDYWFERHIVDEDRGLAEQLRQVSESDAGAVDAAGLVLSPCLLGGAA